MRRASSGETHGILVGSEFSRIFAEILLQEIDSNVKRAIGGTNLVEGRDFSVFRYIDDYFIFFNQPAVADLVQKLIEDELFQYKLFLNENKRTESRRPFVTSISIVKAILKKLVAEELNISTWGRKTFRQRGELLRRIRRTLVEHKVDYSEISSFLMSDILRRVSAFKKTLPENLHSESIVSFLNCAVELCFFIFSVDARFRTSVLLAQLLQALETISTRYGIPNAIELQEIVFRESLGCLRGLRLNGEEQSIELANILVGIERFAASRRIPETLLLKLWFPRSDASFAFNYFNAVPIIYFCKNSPEFFKLKVKVVEGAIARLLEADSIVRSTELFCFALDLISCPFVLRSIRRKLTARICKEVEMKAKTIDECFSELSSRQWLFDWRTDISTEMFLRKKEFSFTY